jgi:diguanylate cyclase (GGDEF)-like protein
LGEEKYGIDPLTELPLRKKFSEEVGRRINGIVRRYLSEVNGRDVGEVSADFIKDALSKKDNKLDEVSFSLWLLDINRFKFVNDEMLGGHEIGDNYLKKFGELMKRVFGRGIDIAGRWGGDELSLASEVTSPDAWKYGKAKLLKDLFNKIEILQSEMNLPDIQSEIVNATDKVGTVTVGMVDFTLRDLLILVGVSNSWKGEGNVKTTYADEMMKLADAMLIKGKRGRPRLNVAFEAKSIDLTSKYTGRDMLPSINELAVDGEEIKLD